MIKSINETIEFNQEFDLLFEELENRPEFGCSGEICSTKGTACAGNF